MTENKEPEYDELMERVDKHLAEDYIDSMSESLHYRTTGKSYVSPPPLWLGIVIVVFFCVVGYLFTHFEVWLP